MRLSRFFRLVWSLVLLAGIAGALPSGARATPAAAGDIQLSAQPFFDGRYRPNSWLPLRITVGNSGQDLDAVVAVQLTATFETTLELPRGANKTLVMYVQSGGGFRRNAVVRVLSGAQELAKVEVPVTSLPATTDVIAQLSAQPMTLPRPAAKSGRKVEVVQLSPGDLPERAEGLSLFDVLLLDGAPLTAITPAQQQALADWVRMGGQLIVGGTKLDAGLAQLPATLRSAAPGDAIPPAAISLLPELAAAPLAGVANLIPAPNTRTIATSDAAAVGVQGEVGHGRVTVLGFSLSAPELAQLPPDATFWREAVQPTSTLPEMMGIQSLDDMQAQQLGFALMTLPVLAIPPLGVLAALLAIYMLLVGPGLYLLLRKLDRQAWGWVAIPVVTLLFSLGAYAYGQRLRGDDIILNQISVVEPAAGRARVRTYAGLFSPRTDTYAITSPSDALFKPMPTGDMGGVPASTGGGRYTQASGGVANLEVPQWSMSTFAAEQIIDGVPLEAELTLADGMLRGTVRNSGAELIRDVALFQNLRVAKIGDLAPGASHSVELKLTDLAPAEWGGSVSMMLLRDKWDFNKPVQPPADIRMQMMVLDAMFSTPYDRPTEPLLLGWLDSAPIGLAVSHGRIHQQQLALVTAPAQVNYAASGRIVLPRGWLKPQLESSAVGGGPCMTQFGSGWFMDTGVLTNTLQLPTALSTTTLDTATLFVQLEGAMADSLDVDLYDWGAASWVSQPDVVGSLPLEQPARYVSPTGAIRMRLDWQASGMAGKGGACVNLDLAVEGMPQ